MIQAGVSTFIDKFILNWPYLYILLYSTAMIEYRGDMDKSSEIAEGKLWKTFRENVKFWTPVLFLIYGLIPKIWRTVADAFAGAIWSCILSFVYHE